MTWMHKAKGFVAKIGIGSWIVLAALVIIVLLITVILRFDVNADNKETVSSAPKEPSSSVQHRPFKEMLELSTKKATINGASVSINFKVKGGTDVVIRDLSGKVKDLRFRAKNDSVYRVNFVHAGKYKVYADRNKVRKTFMVEILDNRKQASSVSSESSAYVEIPSVSSVSESESASVAESSYYTGDTTQSVVDQTSTDSSYVGYYDESSNSGAVGYPSEPDYGGNAEDSGTGEASQETSSVDSGSQSEPANSSQGSNTLPSENYGQVSENQ